MKNLGAKPHLEDEAIPWMILLQDNKNYDYKIQNMQ